MTQLDEERLQQGIQNTLQALIPRLKDVHNLLFEPPKVSLLTLTVLSQFLK
jgi:hypothetical protein